LEATDAQFSHIQVQAIDYRNLQITEEAQIVGSKDGTEEGSGEGIWNDFVANLAAGKLSGSQQRIIQAEPSKMAQLLNQEKLNAEAAVKQYSEILDHCGDDSVVDEETLKRQIETLKNFSKIIKHLKPKLKKQFISSAFKNISAQSSPRSMGVMLNGLNDEMIVDMLQQANEENREISPTLLSLVQKMAVAQTPDPSACSGPDGEDGDEADPQVAIDQMTTLFSREKYESFVDAEYEGTLKSLRDSLAPQEAILENFDLDHHLVSLEDGPLNSRICRILLSVVDQDIEIKSYQVFSRYLYSAVPALLNDGEFALLIKIFKTYFRHGKSHRAPKARMLAKKFLKILYTSRFSADATAAYEKWIEKKEREVSAFMLAVGKGCIPRLINRYCLSEDKDERGSLSSLISGFDAAALEELYTWLQNDRSDVIVKIVNLIGTIGNSTALKQLDPLLNHDDLEVRLAVLENLIKLKDPSSAELLLAALESGETAVVSKAVALSGQYQIPEVAGEIVGKIVPLSLRKSDLPLNEAIIKALGHIGNPDVVPALERIGRKKWTLSPLRLSRIKTILYESLEAYPPESIEDLIRWGLRSKNHRIREACLRLE